MANQRYIVIYDTYCGWCYGAAPLIDALLETGAEVEALHRHLFQGPLAYRLAEGKGALILKSDAKIASLTGQPFSQAYFDNVVMSGTEVLESGYSAQAAALVHGKGAKAAFALGARLQQARFVSGKSAADRDSVTAALIAEGVPASEAEKIGSSALAARAEAVAQKAQQVLQDNGVRGVPAIFRVTRSGLEVVDHSAFYGQPERLAAHVEAQSRRACPQTR